MANPSIFTQCQLGAAKQRCTGGFSEDHRHLPLHEDKIFTICDGNDLHLQFLAALRQAIAHGGKVRFAHHFLDRILEDNFFTIVGENMRPIWFAAGVIGFRPQLQNQLSI